MGRNYEEIKLVLERMKSEMLATSRKKDSMEEPTSTGDDVDRASVLREQEFSIILGARERQKMRNIDAALRKIDNGEYGICEECEEDIPLGRLKVMPFARHCVPCQTDIEKYQAITKTNGGDAFDMFSDESDEGEDGEQGGEE